MPSSVAFHSIMGATSDGKHLYATATAIAPGAINPVASSRGAPPLTGDGALFFWADTTLMRLSLER
jgi:hypothetical protein